MARRESNHTKVYMDFKSGKPLHYVRLGGLETKEFPHGIALATTFTDEKAAETFADKVDAYLEQVYTKK